MKWQEGRRPWVIAAAIVGAALILALALRSDGPGTNTRPEEAAPAPAGENGAAPKPDIAPAPTGASGGTAAGVQTALTYTAAVKKYGERRLQLDEQCQAQPTNLTFKAGTAVMVDNRSDNTRAVTVGTRNYTIQPWGWAIVSMPSVRAQTRLMVDCDALENVATFLVQP